MSDTVVMGAVSNGSVAAKPLYSAGDDVPILEAEAEAGGEVRGRYDVLDGGDRRMQRVLPTGVGVADDPGPRAR